MKGNTGNRSLIKSIAPLVINRGLSQGLIFLSTIFAAKHTSPEVFGEVGLFTSLCSFFSMGSSLRFEIKALVCSNEKLRDRLICCAYISNLIFLFAFFVLSTILFSFFDLPSWLMLFPIGVFLTSTTSYILPAQNYKLDQLARLGAMNHVNGVVISSLQVACSYLFPTSFSLIVSRLFGWLSASLFMSRDFILPVKKIKSTTVSKFKRALKVNSSEIGFGVPAAIVSVATLQVPVYMFNFLGMRDASGIYWLSFNLLFVPYLVVMGSVRPVFIRMIYLWKSNGNAHQMMVKATVACALLGFFIAVTASFISAEFSRYFLDDSWSNSRHFSYALSILLFSLIAQSPISVGISSFSLQKANFYFGVFQVLVRALAMALAYFICGDAISCIYAFAVSSFVTYVFYIKYCLGKVRLLSE